jgi:hypothetical protein
MISTRYFFLTGLLMLCRIGAAQSTDTPPSPITNDAVWKKGQPQSFAKVSRPPVQSEVIFAPGENDWKYSHHQSITAFNHQLYAIWSSSERNEDSSGQRVMYSLREENGWIKPRILFQPNIEHDGRLRVLTAAGFHEYKGMLVAYAGDYSIDRKSTRLLARTSKDGRVWTDVQDLHVPVCPNHGP